MRTTLDLESTLLRAAKERAAAEGTTLTAILEEALRAFLNPPDRSERRVRIRLLTKKGRIASGLDFADRNALFERMEGRG